jgi:hypothetical protein
LLFTAYNKLCLFKRILLLYTQLKLTVNAGLLLLLKLSLETYKYISNSVEVTRGN